MVKPEAVPAASSGMKPDEVVVGVVSNGRARAYRLDAMRDRARHIVNDVVGGSAVTVTYCDLTDCIRSYADPSSAAVIACAFVLLVLAVRATQSLASRAWKRG